MLLAVTCWIEQDFFHYQLDVLAGRAWEVVGHGGFYLECNSEKKTNKRLSYDTFYCA